MDTSLGIRWKLTLAAVGMVLLPLPGLIPLNRVQTDRLVREKDITLAKETTAVEAAELRRLTKLPSFDKYGDAGTDATGVPPERGTDRRNGHAPARLANQSGFASAPQGKLPYAGQ